MIVKKKVSRGKLIFERGGGGGVGVEGGAGEDSSFIHTHMRTINLISMQL